MGLRERPGARPKRREWALGIMQTSKQYKQSPRSSTHPEVCAAGAAVGVRDWEGTWAAVRRGADGQVQVGKPFGSRRAQLRSLTVGGFLEAFENSLLGRLFVSSSGAQFKGARGWAEPR